jgi:type IV pilus assembly protein PilX
MKTRKSINDPRRQSGAALAVGLVFLVVLSLSLVMSFRASILQERMAGGFRNESLAENAAESALRAGENWLWDWIVANPNRALRQDERPFVHAVSTLDVDAQSFRQTREWSADGAEYGDTTIADTSYGVLAHQPRFQIEVIGTEGRSGGGGGGGTGEARTLVTHLSLGGGYAGSAGGSGGSAGIIEYYRITSRGAGGTEGVVRVLESTFTTTR